MTFERLDAHIATLGAVEKVSPIGEAEQRALAALVDAAIPPALAWWWARIGGASFVEPIVYPDPKVKEDVLLGWFLDGDEVRDAIDSWSESIAPHRLPIVNDGGDNLLVVDPDGSVYQHLHDKPLDRNGYLVASSFEQFVLSLHVGD